MMGLKKIIFSVLVSYYIFLGCSILAAEEAVEIETGAYKGYNVILVSFDALAAGHVSCLGYSRKTTPMINRFAKEGFLFKNAIAQSSWTVPSTMSYLTSLYPSGHKLVNKYSTYTKDEKTFSNLKNLSPGIITFAEVLKESGYATGGFTGDAGVGAKFGFSDGFDAYFEGPIFGGMDRSIPEAIEWLKKNKGKIFFMFLHGYDVHGQFDPPAGFKREFVDFDYKGPLVGGKEVLALLREKWLETGYIDLSREDVRFLRALYDEKVKDVDERFSVFVDELKKMGLLKKTVIILFSDHGEEFYEHKGIDHGHSLYDELIHVPLIIWLPGAKGGVTIDDQVRAIDVVPTLLDLLGAKVSDKAKKQMQGVSLLPLLNGGHMELPAFSETDYRFYTFKKSLRTPDGFKFIYSMDTAARELYDLKNDPGELNNLVEKEKRLAYELEQKLFEWMKSMGQGENYYKELLKGVLKIKEY